MRKARLHAVECGTLTQVPFPSELEDICTENLANMS